MLPQEKSIEIHQTLHGYQNGHQLLATSLELPPTTRRLMLSFSDLSGSSTGIKFDSYLTGYPVAELGMYAFARTWYANEMRRPGCVWTQTLLITFDALDYIQELRGLTGLFVRPLSGEYGVSTTYSETALYNLTSVNNGIEMISPNFIEDTLKGLYLAPESPVIVPAPNFEVYELLALALISQQWPRLQRNFTFCTGTILPRSLNGRTFDLQIIPNSAILKFQRDIPDGIFVGVTPVAHQYKENDLAWCDVAYHDLVQTTSSLTRSFLRAFGVDVSPTRHAFALLANTFLDISKFRQKGMSLQGLLDSVAERFSMPREASMLKMKLFGKVSDDDKPLISVSAIELLTAIASCAGYKSYDADTLQLRQRAAFIAKNDLAQTAKLIVNLIQCSLNVLGEHILEAIFEALHIDDLLCIAEMRPSLLPLFVSHYPELATTPKVWQGSLDQQQQLVDTLIRRPDVPWSKVTPVMLQNHVQGVAADLINALGYTTFEAIFDWINQSSKPECDTIPLVTNEWRQLLTLQPEHIAGWLAQNDALQIHTQAFVISLLNPRSKLVKEFLNDEWVEFAEKAKIALSGKEQIDVMAFFLAFALDNSSTVAPKLASIAFRYVHEAASQENLSQQSWRWFQGQVPTFDYWRDWDRCEKLRQALVNAFVKFDWSPTYFISALTTEDMFARALDYCTSFSSGRAFATQLQNMINRENLNVPEYIYRLLKGKQRRKASKV